ncbi:1,4-dihydroxy-2-naphthoate polyprenyltransferase [Amycolatopsis acidiphila]|uniref:1,4-dihydroxy-2-naphthoate octaprenyltransferase n=1 Tax=Amycolatopsis acidiphila TaxID=715473 RepID=A0A558A001_9PSEU|nr:1,4-dihydroxy-2-naphthoate polyprenyltransferase [Amycolatopsis acidiphila]TVT17567.1 1,4-dihydroxy-2-naphthoate polyprenyltransferase [Amycolatopsis acidiphila]UIJ60528.1 1,4-dihydroxy-2-naphthoate polyprenyltransferase [Amycolatopsis acidiphila]GHG82329.1 1,4-dihydroxy-2-naphthoate octaprenyltransferase [Amycolatopsis acidiphila]
MATVAEWIEGARPRTLPNAVAPVVAGVGATIQLGAFSWWQSLLALLVALSLIIGVNFANDYSDGIRGTDENRVGPLRLVGSGVAAPKLVLTAALTCLGVAGVLGLVLVIATGRWWLLVMGAVCILGAWFYTGGKKPYGYVGLGEIAVFVFFGLAAVLGTVYVQADRLSWAALGAAVAVGCFSTAVLTANNLRDIPTDREVGKNTLAVRLGDTGTRRFYLTLVAIPYVITILLGVFHPLVLIALITAVLLRAPLKAILSGGTGPGLIPVLRDTGLVMLGWSVLSGIALALS